MNTNPSFRDMLARVSVLFKFEQRVFGLIVSYALAIGLFSLIVPLTVQELVNTFAFSIQPIMIVTLAAIMVLTLLCVGAFRALQFYAVEILERRIFARIALALTQLLPRLQVQGFLPRYANYFFETVLLQRSLSVLLVDVINVLVGGMTIGIALIRLTQIAVCVDLDHTEIGMFPRMGANSAKRTRMFTCECDN